MNFSEKKQLVGRYIDKIYSELESDLSICKKFEIIQGSFQIEYKKLCNYAVAIKDDLKNEAIDELEKKGQKNYQKLSDDFESIAKGFKVPTVNLEENLFFNISSTKTEDRISSASGQNTEKLSSYTMIGAGLGLVLGGGVGAFIGKEIASIVIGAALGGVVGGVVGKGMSSTDSNAGRTLKAGSNNETIVTKKISQEKIHYFVQERNKKIKSLFLNYIDEFENAYNR
jgi:uncharacterized membrane protein